jgi:hypothetical protein
MIVNSLNLNVMADTKVVYSSILGVNANVQCPSGYKVIGAEGTPFTSRGGWIYGVPNTSKNPSFVTYGNGGQGQIVTIFCDNNVLDVLVTGNSDSCPNGYVQTGYQQNSAIGDLAYCAKGDIGSVTTKASALYTYGRNGSTTDACPIGTKLIGLKQNILGDSSCVKYENKEI